MLSRLLLWLPVVYAGSSSHTKSFHLFPGVHPVLCSQSKGQLSCGNAYRKVTSATCAHALARSNAADAARADSGASRLSQSNASRSLCLLWHSRKYPVSAKGISGRGTLLVQTAEQPELAQCDSVAAVPTAQGAVSSIATQAVSPFLCGDPSYRYVVKQLLTSVVQEICMLRSVGAGSG